jgi:hypothetical protein
MKRGPLVFIGLLLSASLALNVVQGLWIRHLAALLSSKPNVYIVEEIEPGYIGDQCVGFYQLVYAIRGIKMTIDFPTRERLDAYKVYLRGVGPFVGPQDDGGWSAAIATW